MNAKETAEIRKRLTADRCGISRVRGCCVNDKKEMISTFDLPLGMMYQDEVEKLLGIIRKALSGKIGRNLLDISFTNKQVLEGEDHKLLMTLRKDGGMSESADRTSAQSGENGGIGGQSDPAKELYSRIVASYASSDPYVILLASDSYDVPRFHKDGAVDEDSSEVFSFLICAICPTKLTKPALGINTIDNRLQSIKPDSVICPPEVGFMFPAFTDRRTDIYSALYYTRSVKDNHAELPESLFGFTLQMPAAAQKETFNELLSDTLSENCSLELVQEIRTEIAGMMKEHKESKESDTLTLRGATIGKVLEELDVPPEKVKCFTERFDSEFGDNAELIPENIIAAKKLELRTPDVVIKVNPDRPELVTSEIINGQKYILIKANEGVELNGVRIRQ